VSPSAQIGKGCIIEPMATVHTGCVLGRGCLVSPGAVINHCAKLCDGVHVDCNATVAGYTLVPTGTKVCSGEVYRGDPVNAAELFRLIQDLKSE
jgi:UDP-3-O-[3-hydroxymyristoyl] glucosamine N-acyltransferase